MYPAGGMQGQDYHILLKLTKLKTYLTLYPVRQFIQIIIESFQINQSHSG
jgi:hypothetical protein